MTAPTSAIAHEEIVLNGLVKKLHKDIVRAFQSTSMLGTNMTSSEIAKTLKIERDSISPRLPELARLSVLMRDIRRKCTVTGKYCVAWRLTGLSPKEPKKQYFMKCGSCQGHGKIEIFPNEPSR